MHDRNKSGLENACKELWSGFQGVLSWKWDSRFETVLAEFACGQERKHSGNPGAISKHYMGQLQYW